MHVSQNDWDQCIRHTWYHIHLYFSNLQTIKTYTPNSYLEFEEKSINMWLTFSNLTKGKAKQTRVH